MVLQCLGSRSLDTEEAEVAFAEADGAAAINWPTAPSCLEQSMPCRNGRTPFVMGSNALAVGSTPNKSF